MKHSVLKELYTARYYGHMTVNKLIYLIERLEDLLLQFMEIRSLCSSWCILTPFECSTRHMDKVVRPIFTRCCFEEGYTLRIEIVLRPFKEYIPCGAVDTVEYVFTIDTGC